MCVSASSITALLVILVLGICQSVSQRKREANLGIASLDVEYFISYSLLSMICTHPLDLHVV